MEFGLNFSAGSYIRLFASLTFGNYMYVSSSFHFGEGGGGWTLSFQVGGARFLFEVLILSIITANSSSGQPSPKLN